MRRALLFFALAACLAAAGLMAQDAGSVLLTYQRNFVRSSLSTKLELLKEAGKSATVDMGPLYDTALRFTLDNIGLLGQDAQLRDLALLALKKVGESGWPKAADDVWSVFQVYAGDAELRAAAVLAYSRTGAAEAKTVSDLVSFLASQNTLYKSGLQPEYPAFEAAVDALGALASDRAYQVLFATYVAGPNSTLKYKAASSMTRLGGQLSAFLAEVIAKSPVLEKVAALELGLGVSTLLGDEQGYLSEAALSAALDWRGDSPVEQSAIRKLRNTAIREIKELGWQRAAPLAIRHFRLLLADYNDGKVAESDLLDAVACLGAMGSTEAAQALSLYLQLVNAQTEQGKPWDEALLLGVIDALGSLGDKVAFDYLLYVGYLQYPESIKGAAKAALQELKW
jgi:hypothetical protein